VGSLKDQRLLKSLIGRSLVYHSEPLQQDLEITGFFSLDAWISIDCPDTDLYVSVHEV
jgi:predicted acyl esterase